MIMSIGLHASPPTMVYAFINHLKLEMIGDDDSSSVDLPEDKLTMMKNLVAKHKAKAESAQRPEKS